MVYTRIILFEQQLSAAAGVSLFKQQRSTTIFTMVVYTFTFSKSSHLYKFL
ncbi:MAG TPA: hypothetical protein VFY41_04130 [Nitrososphaeraceae archaeon]|nr:hypothetical protein [Nitrososphaeraceae archaeon]